MSIERNVSLTLVRWVVGSRYLMVGQLAERKINDPKFEGSNQATPGD